MSHPLYSPHSLLAIEQWNISLSNHLIEPLKLAGGNVTNDPSGGVPLLDVREDALEPGQHVPRVRQARRVFVGLVPQVRVQADHGMVSLHPMLKESPFRIFWLDLLYILSYFTICFKLVKDILMSQCELFSPYVRYLIIIVAPHFITIIIVRGILREQLIG